MQYTFTFRRTTGLLFLAGLAVCFALTFLAGWVVGLNTQVSALVADTMAASSEDPPRDQWRASAPADSVTGRNNESLSDRTALPGSGLADSPDTAADAQDPSASPEPAYALQIGAYADSSSAQRMVRRVQADDRSARVRIKREGGRTLYQVQVGPYERRRRAVQHVDSVRTYTGNAFVVQIRPTP
jgi:cell division septation protein DedD